MGIDDHLNIAFGKILREIRTSKHLTQEELGLEAGLRRTFISSLELGEKQPSLNTIYKLSIALQVPMPEILRRLERILSKTDL